MMIRKKQNKHFSKKEVGIFMLNLSPVQKSLLFGHQKLDILPSFSPPSLCHLFTSVSSFLLSSTPPLSTAPYSLLPSASFSPLSPFPYCPPLLFSLLLPSVSLSLLSPTPLLSPPLCLRLPIVSHSSSLSLLLHLCLQLVSVWSLSFNIIILLTVQKF